MDDAVDDLFGLALNEFIVARDGLAARLRAAGDKDGAKAVKALRRPSVAAWAVNQVARNDAALVEAVTAAGADVARAQGALAAGGEPGELRAATARRREAVHAATRAATALAGETHRDAVAATFEAAAGGAAEEVRAGRLTRELQPSSSFDVGPAGSAPAPVDDAEAQRSATLDTARRRAEEAEAAVQRSGGALAGAERRHADATAALEAATERAQAAEAAARQARIALEELVTGR